MTFSTKVVAQFTSSLNMKTILFVLPVLLNAVSIYGKKSVEHVHFRIYVPELIKHHIHTRTIFIHVAHPPKKKTYRDVHLSNYYKNRNSYKTFNNQYDYGVKNGGLIYSNLLANNYLSDYELFHHLTTPIPFYDDYQGSSENDEDKLNANTPSTNNFNNGANGYSYPPQYQTHENTDEISQNDINSYEKDEHEEGHKSGHEIKAGHVYANEMNNYYDDQHEESTEKYLEGSNEENYKYLSSQYHSAKNTDQNGG